MLTRITYLAIAAVSLAACLHAQLDRAGPPSIANSLVRDTARVSAGASHFQQLCTGCHGRGGQGGQGEGQGPNLATNWEVRRAKDPELFAFIRNGVKGTAMPAFALPDEQIWQLAAFVRSLNAPAVSLPVQGNVSTGETIFFGKGGCSACHMIRGRGGYLGPDLSDIGMTRRTGELRDALEKPSAKASADFQPVLIQDAHGDPVRAVAKHSSAWAVELLDEKGTLHFVRGADVRTLAYQEKSWMSDDFTQRLSQGERTDVIAYLSRQAVRPPFTEPDAGHKGSTN